MVNEPLLLTLTSPPIEDTSVTSKEANPAPHMEPIWDTIQSIAKARSRAKAEATENPAKEYLLDRDPTPPPTTTPLTYKPVWCIFHAFYGCAYRKR